MIETPKSRWFEPNVDLALHGHVHLFEALGFAPSGTPTFVLGNSGSMADGSLPSELPPDARAIAGVRIDGFTTSIGFGFALLERKDEGWRPTEYAEDGKPLIECDVAAPALRECRRGRSLNIADNLVILVRHRNEARHIQVCQHGVIPVVTWTEEGVAYLFL